MGLVIGFLTIVSLIVGVVAALSQMGVRSKGKVTRVITSEKQSFSGCPGCHSRGINGWDFWEAKRPGDNSWVKLGKLPPEGS